MSRVWRALGTTIALAIFLAWKEAGMELDTIPCINAAELAGIMATNKDTML